MEENKTTRVNRTVNYYSDRPDYDRHMEKHNCHCERPHYDHCPAKPDYDCYQERPHYDHCPAKPDYDHHPVKPDYDHHPVKPNYDHYPAKPNYDHYPAKPDYDHHPVKPNYDHHPVGPNHDCHDEKPKHECCEDKLNCDFCSERPKPGCCCPDLNLKPNGCTKCCNPINVKYPDIHCAVCTPILADRMCAFACTDQTITRLFPESVEESIVFTIDNPPMGGFQPGASVCIEKIAVQYTCAGFTAIGDETTLPITICSFTGALGNRGSLGCSPADALLFNSYEGTITPRFLCHNDGTKATFGHTDLTANILGIQYIVQGFIGCTPFTARTDMATVAREYTGINLFGNICLPKPKNDLTLRANFDFDLSVKQIIPSPDGISEDGDTFTAQILDVLRINERLFALTPDELVVYSSPDGFSFN